MQYPKTNFQPRKVCEDVSAEQLTSPWLNSFQVAPSQAKHTGHCHIRLLLCFDTGLQDSDRILTGKRVEGPSQSFRYPSRLEALAGDMFLQALIDSLTHSLAHSLTHTLFLLVVSVSLSLSLPPSLPPSLPALSVPSPFSLPTICRSPDPKNHGRRSAIPRALSTEPDKNRALGAEDAGSQEDARSEATTRLPGWKLEA